MKKLIITAMCACLAIAAMANETVIPGTGGIPDLTKGGSLTRINSRWAGPVGINCGTWRPGRGHKTTDIRQLLVLEVEKGSPADGVLEFGDVILGADGTGAKTVPLFTGADWAMIPIANAITEAEAHNPALLNLLVWRPAIRPQAPATDAKAKTPAPVFDLDALDAEGGGKASDEDDKPFIMPKTNAAGGKVEGKTITVTIKLETLGRYSDTAPYNCEKSKNILRKGIKKLYEDNRSDLSGFGMLCLLAADDPTNPDNDKYQARAKEWAHKLEYNSGPWFSGPQLISLSEYYMKTKDESIFPKLVKAAEHHAKGVSWFGTTGHKWADKKPDGSPGGRLSGYGPINASGAVGFLGLSLARKAGVKSPVVDAANERQRKFFGHYAFHGGIGYGEMPYAIAGGKGDPNGRHAMPALALGLQEGREEKAKYFSQMTALAPYDQRQYGHGGPFFGQVFAPLAAAQGGEKSANLQFKEIRWHLDLKRKWNHTRIYDSSGNGYSDFGWDATALLFYALPLKQLYITGRGQNEALQFSDAEFKELPAIQAFDAEKATTQELIAELSRHQGMTRGAACTELVNRINKAPESPEAAALVDQILALAADSKSTTSGRAGACTAMMFLKGRARGPVEALKNAEIAKTMVNLLKDPDPYIRFGGVRALQNLNPEAIRPYVNDILDAAIATGRPTFPLDEEDPVQWAHGEMGALLFQHVLAKSLDGVDRKKMFMAIRSLLKTPNATARTATSSVLANLTEPEILELADVIVDNTIEPPPANAMGGTGAPKCFSVLTKYMFEEALPLSVLYDNASGQGVAFVIRDKAPEKYGRAVLNMESGMDFMSSLGHLMMSKGQDTRPALKAIINNPAPGKLNQLKSIHSVKAAESTLTLPAAQTELVVDATNYGRTGENETTYTWRKVYGAGKVTFTPNASGQSKKTTVSFTDGKPGKYRFEVAMSDILGFTTVRQTVDVTLYDKRGQLPANKPPQATSQAFAAVPGRPGLVQLSGTDPDGDDLGFAVTKEPAHGRLTGIGNKLTYTANYGFNGTDQLTFEAIDGQGETASGTIQFKISDKDVGVAVYEPFDGYPTGPIAGQASKGIGLQGVWETGKGNEVVSGSLNFSALPSSGGKLSGGGASIAIDPAVLTNHRLLENGRELWFSAMVGKRGRSGFHLIGDDASVGFLMSNQRLIAATNKDRVTGHYDSAYINHFLTVAEVTHRQKLSGGGIDWSDTGPNMVIGRCIWGKTDEDKDTVEIYRVVDVPDYGPLIITKPISVTKDQVAQSRFNKIQLNGDTTWDEVRIGPSLNSVLMGTTPLLKVSDQ